MLRERPCFVTILPCPATAATNAAILYCHCSVATVVVVVSPFVVCGKSVSNVVWLGCRLPPPGTSTSSFACLLVCGVSFCCGSPRTYELTGNQTDAN